MHCDVDSVPRSNFDVEHLFTKWCTLIAKNTIFIVYSGWELKQNTKKTKIELSSHEINIYRGSLIHNIEVERCTIHQTQVTSRVASDGHWLHYHPHITVKLKNNA